MMVLKTYVLKNNHSNITHKMNIVIIEDEAYAARRLQNMILELDPADKVTIGLESVTDSVKWFRNNPAPDLIFMDLHLEDDLSFAIFDHVTIACPIVITTASDDLSTKAFTLKQIDYLLKPIIQADIVSILEKYKKLPVSARSSINASIFADIINKNN